MNKTALFCDGTEGYVYPPEPKDVWGKSRSDIVSKCSLGQKNIIMDDVESLARSWSTITLL